MWGSVLSNEAIIAMVGHEAFARGMVYARNGKVCDVEIDTESMVVSGRVVGGYRDGYEASVRLIGSDEGRTGHQGRCSCPVALDCKHAAALLIVARSSVAQTEHLSRPAWEVTLHRVLSGAGSVATDQVELGLEIGVERTPAFRGQGLRTQLRMRPLRRGSGGGWLRSQISWEELDFASSRYRPDQRDLLVQFRSAVGASARFALPRSPWLGLTSVSAGFWALLADARRIGMQIVGEGAASDPLTASSPAGLVFDAHQVEDGVELTPVALLNDQPLPAGSWGLIGEPAHGMYRHDPELTLARLAEPLTREVRRLVDENSPVRVPDRDRSRFVAEFLPALRRVVPVISLDGDVTFPPPARPRLELDVTYRPERRVRMDWVLGYDLGDHVQRFSLDDPITLVRDPQAEAEILAGVDLPYEQIPALRGRGLNATPAAHALLAEVDAAMFMAETVPKLRAAGITVTESGEPVDYRLVENPPRIELSPARIPHADWFDLHVRIRVDGEAVPFEEVFAGLSKGEEFLVLDSGVYIPLRRPELLQLQSLITEARLLPDRDRATVRLHRDQVDLWQELLASGVVIDQDIGWQSSVAALAADAREAGAEIEVPGEISAELRPYQVEGFRWAARLHDHQLGGILADDMGLGKTLQALTMITRARRRQPDARPFLVVAPTSVVSTWAGEARRFTPALRVVTISGTQSRTGASLAEQASDADVVITSYALLRIDADAYAELDWSGMIIDEAQFVKNHRSRTYQAARRVPARTKIAITGTPLENSLMDLWALFSLTAPGLFGPPERFAEFYRRPIERDHDADRLALLRRRIRPLLLRRTKEMVATELPPRAEQVLDVVLQPRHRKLYQTYLQRERQKVLGLLTDLDGNRFTILRSLTLLRRLALDPALVDDQHEGVPASKIDILVEMLTEIGEEGHQALVFSQFTSLLHRVADRLDEAGLSHTLLEGRTRDRERVIAEFRSGQAKVFLISLKAGGFGLNLIEADYCFLLDPWWNPAAEAQAVDRAHRIGQQRTVMVYRMVAGETIETKVMALKERKRALFDAVVGDEAWSGGALDEDDVRELLSLPVAPTAEPGSRGAAG